MNSNLMKRSLSIALTLLAACGGGGDSGTPTPVPVTYTSTKTCWDNSRPVSTVSQVDADTKVPASCPPITTTGVTVSIVNGVLTFAGFPSGAAITGSTLTATSASSTVSYTDGILRSGTLLGSATYTYSGATVAFTNAPNATLAGTFLSPALASAWPTNVKALFEPGVVNGTVNPALAVRTWLALNPVTNVIGDAAWNANLVNGNVQIVKSGEMAPDINGVQRNIWRAEYTRVIDTASGKVGYCMSPIFADTGMSYVNDNAVGTTCYTSAPIYVVGVSDSVNPANNGVIYAFMDAGNQLCSRLTVRGGALTTCPF
jgi:hypothetical protein